MLGVEGYGSDSDSDSETPQLSPPKPTTAVKPTKSGLSLPPPSASSSSTSKPSGLSLPAPKKKGPKKITIGLPSLPDEPADDDKPPPAKKARLEAGAGSSALLGMLPAPKNKNPVLPQHERMLGGGRGRGLVFHTKATTVQSASVEDAEEEDESELTNEVPLAAGILEEVQEVKETKRSVAAAALPFLPPSLAKGRANVSTEETHTISRAATATAAAKSSTPAIDFFSLGKRCHLLHKYIVYLNSTGSAGPSSTPTPRSAISTPSAAPKPSTSSLPSISSAPQIEEFVPPQPSREDPYPGYYLLPSGQWAAHDPAYYKKFYDKWKKEYDAHVRALEKGAVKGFEALETEGAEEVNAAEEMERAKREIQEREEKKSLTMGGQEAQAAPKMNIKVCWVSFGGSGWDVVAHVGRPGCCVERTREGTASAVDAPHGSVPESGGVGREDCNGTEEQKGGWQQIRCVLSLLCSLQLIHHCTQVSEVLLLFHYAIITHHSSVLYNIIRLYAGNYICILVH